MHNCAPTILVNYCKDSKVNCEELEYYCKNRDTIIEEIIKDHGVDKDFAKELFLCLICNGTYKAKLGWICITTKSRIHRR